MESKIKYILAIYLIMIVILTMYYIAEQNTINTLPIYSKNGKKAFNNTLINKIDKRYRKSKVSQIIT